MWEPHNKSLKIKTVILIALSVSFVPISYLWYDALSGLECNKSYQNGTMVNSGGNHNSCLSQTGTHWVIFYGVNAMVYGMPLALILKSTRNKSQDLD